MTAATSRFSRPASGAPRSWWQRWRLTPARRWMLRLASVGALLLAWEIYGQLLNPILLSSPTAVVSAGVGMIADGSLPQALGESLIVLGLGLASGVTVGVTLGLLAGRSETLAALLELPVNAVYATPAVALIPIIVLWFGFEVTAKVVVVFLFVVFPVLINTTRGVREVDPELI